MTISPIRLGDILLPFISKNKQASSVGLSVKERPSDNPSRDSQGAEKIEICAIELLLAVKKNDAKGVAEAMYNAWSILESQEDQPESQSTDFYSQNALASKERY